MAGNGESDAYRCGRLYAALHALRKSVTGQGDLADPARLNKAAGNPGNELREHLKSAGDYLGTALVKKDKQRMAAAIEAFRSLTEFAPPGGLPSGGFGETARQEFGNGYTDQLCAYKEKFGSLLK
ncbi:hypothetical protein [Streptomyces sp. KR55]|uniref:hypothetical protein n=1 Tax=Streptomyces sp. KR55 TaxID=3457425 RepID=UPI003FD32CA9